MARKYQNFMSGTLSVGISATDTTISSTGLAALTAVANPDVLYLVLDPAGINGAPEILFVIAHSGGVASATVTRGQEGTTARSHNAGVSWVAGVTAFDMGRFDIIEAPGWVVSTRLVDGAVTSAKLGNGSVIAGKIAGGAITPSNLFAASVVDTAALADGAVVTSKLADGAVTAVKLSGTLNITYAQLEVATRVQVSRIATQAIPTSTITDVIWDTKTDPDNFIGVPGTTFTVPTNKAGFYIIQTIISPEAGMTGMYLRVTVNGSIYVPIISAAAAGVAYVAEISFPLAVGDTVKLSFSTFF